VRRAIHMGGMTNAYKILVAGPEGNLSLGKIYTWMAGLIS